MAAHRSSSRCRLFRLITAVEVAVVDSIAREDVAQDSAVEDSQDEDVAAIRAVHRDPLTFRHVSHRILLKHSRAVPIQSAVDSSTRDIRVMPEDQPSAEGMRVAHILETEAFRLIVRCHRRHLSIRALHTTAVCHLTAAPTPINLHNIQLNSIHNSTEVTTTTQDMARRDTVQTEECIRLSKENMTIQLVIIRITIKLILNTINATATKTTVSLMDLIMLRFPISRARTQPEHTTEATETTIPHTPKDTMASLLTIKM